MYVLIKMIEFFYFPPVDPDHIEVRLVVNDAETNDNKGLVQVFVDGHWGGICRGRGGFGGNEANVVCRSLDRQFTQGMPVYFAAELYNSWPDEKAFLKNFDCFACSLCHFMTDCSYEALVDSSCSSDDFVGVECYPFSDENGFDSKLKKKKFMIVHSSFSGCLTTWITWHAWGK